MTLPVESTPGTVRFDDDPIRPGGLVIVALVGLLMLAMAAGVVFFAIGALANWLMGVQ